MQRERPHPAICVLITMQINLNGDLSSPNVLSSPSIIPPEQQIRASPVRDTI